jgi:hypothetical protein
MLDLRLPHGLSVVTLVKNNIDDFLITFDSVKTLLVDLSYDIQFIVIDSSSDDSVKLLLDNDPCSNLNISYYKLPPIGIFPSMNFALGKVSLDSMIYMNSGDYFLPGVSSLLDIGMKARREAGAYCFVSNVNFVLPAGVRVGSWYPPFLPHKYISYILSFKNPCHQAVIFSTLWHIDHLYSEVSSSADILLLKRASKRSVYSHAPFSCFCLNGLTSGTLSRFQYFSRFRSSMTLSNFRLLLKSLLYSGSDDLQFFRLRLAWFRIYINLAFAILFSRRVDVRLILDL